MYYLLADEYQNLLAAVFSVIELLQCRAFILPGIPSPPQVWKIVSLWLRQHDLIVFQVISTPLAKYMELSMDLVTYLGRYCLLWLAVSVQFVVSCASFKPSQPQESILVSGCGLLDKLVEGWKLCRGTYVWSYIRHVATCFIHAELKVEVCVNKLLSATAFDSYMKNEAEHGMVSNSIYMTFIAVQLLPVRMERFGGHWHASWPHWCATL